MLKCLSKDARYVTLKLIKNIYVVHKKMYRFHDLASSSELSTLNWTKSKFLAIAKYLYTVYIIASSFNFSIL